MRTGLGIYDKSGSNLLQLFEGRVIQNVTANVAVDVSSYIAFRCSEDVGYSYNNLGIFMPLSMGSITGVTEKNSIIFDTSCVIEFM